MKKYYAFLLVLLVGLFFTSSVCGADCTDCDLNGDYACDDTDVSLFGRYEPDLNGDDVFDANDSIIFNEALSNPECRYQLCACEFVPGPTDLMRGVDSLDFEVSVRNLTDLSGPVRFGTKITAPNGGQSGYIWGPFTVRLDPFEEVSGGGSHAIPSFLPLGLYTYHGYVSVLGTIVAECEFDFQITELRNWNYR